MFITYFLPIFAHMKIGYYLCCIQQIKNRTSMKRIFSLLSIFWSITLLVQAQPKITFDKPEQDLGYILWRTPTTITYNFTNTGDKPLVISNVTTSCGCTEATWTETPIPAGGKGQVTAVFDAEAIGRFYKEVGVYCNASSLPLYLGFNGEVTADPKNFTFTHPYGFGAIRLNQEELNFDAVNKGDKPTVELLVANTSNKGYSPVLMHLPPYLSAEAVPERLGRGKAGKIVVTLDTDKLPKLGITRSSVYLSRFPGDKVGSDNEIPVSVALLPDFSGLTEQQKNNPPVVSLSAKQLDFPSLKPKQKKSQTIVITNTGKSDLVIQDMQVFSIALGVNLKKRTLKPGESTKMKVTVLAANLPRVKGTPRILMITNDPNHPMVNIRVKASLREVK